MILMQPDQFNLMPHTDMEFPDSETIRVWKTGSLEPDINTYAGVAGSSFHNGTIEVDVCGRLRSDAPDYARGFIGIVFRAADDGREFESFYIRPANGRECEDPVRKAQLCIARLEDLMSQWKGRYNSSISISTGVASNENHDSIESIVAAADQNMYEYKRNYYISQGIDRRRR